MIGIVGGGQLGRMLTQAATSLGFRVIVVDPTDNCPAAQVGAIQIIGNLNDEFSLRKLAEKADYITVEIEHLSAKALKKIAALGKPVNTAPDTIALIQDKFNQKVFLQDNGFPVAQFKKINSLADAQNALEEFGGSMILKTRRNAFDGRGNATVQSNADIKSAIAKFGDAELYGEKILDFKKELAAIIVKDSKNNLAAYPLVETVHERNICVEVKAPAPVPEKLQREALQLAEKVVNKLEGAGVYGIELFQLEDNSIVINEIAPRVHNSGHFTLDACETSQFEQHIRAISGLPLGSTKLNVPAACMINILGERNGPTKLTGLHKALQNPKISVHIYGKSPTKTDRKMGHINAWGETLEEARKAATMARKYIGI